MSSATPPTPPPLPNQSEEILDAIPLDPVAPVPPVPPALAYATPFAASPVITRMNNLLIVRESRSRRAVLLYQPSSR